MMPEENPITKENTDMVRGTYIDLQRLKALVEEGKSEAEIMTELDIRESGALQQALLEVMRQATSGFNIPGEVDAH
jgi:hypothetical protein